MISLTPSGQQLFLKAVIPEPIGQQKEVKASFTSQTNTKSICVHMCFIDADRHRQIVKDLAKLNEENSAVKHTGL